MKIAIHTPFIESAELSSGISMINAGKKLGHEIKMFNYVDDINNFNPDFVLVCQKALLKLTRFPTYGYLFESLDGYHNKLSLLSWDGYLAISPKNLSFAEDLCYSNGKLPFKKIFYNTSHISLDENNKPFKSSIEALKNPSLIYAGFNWDYRYLDLLHLLSKENYFKVYGPKHKWQNYPKIAYQGPLPFTENAVIDAYRQAGVGLALQSAYFTYEDAISNRIFEINSAGAVAITGYMPFVEKYYKDTILYFDPFAKPQEILKQINEHMLWIKKNPQAAFEKALKAQEIFHNELSIEKLFENVIEYHEQAKINSGYTISNKTENYPPIGIIVRTGGRDIEALRGTLDSLVNQSYPNVIPVIIIYAQNYALMDIFKEYRGKFTKLDVITNISNLRSTSLWSGLNHIVKEGYEFFGILDDDDEYFSNNVMCAYNFLKDNNYDLGFSLVVHEDSKSINKYEDIVDKRYIRRVPLEKKIKEMLGNVCTNGFLARAKLLDDKILQDPIMHTGEDSYLFYSLCTKTLPYFNARVLSLVNIGGSDQSNFIDHPERLYNIAKIENRFIGKRFANGELITNHIKSDYIYYPKYVHAAHNYPLMKNPNLLKYKIIKFLKPYKPFIVKFISRPLRIIGRIFRKIYNMELDN